MGFLEYARSMFFEKDSMRAKVLVSHKLRFSRFLHDEVGCACVFPEPVVKEDKYAGRMLSLFGCCFPDDAEGMRQAVTLFRASVFHLGAHALVSRFEDYEDWGKGRNLFLARFSSSVVEDVRANAYVSVSHPEALVDFAFADALSLKRLRRVDRFVNPATRIMAGLLLRAHCGPAELRLGNEAKAVESLGEIMKDFERSAAQTNPETASSLKDQGLRLADEIYRAVEDAGPVTEAPFLPHTEEIGGCSIFHDDFLVDSDILLDDVFKRCLESAGGGAVSVGERSGKAAEAEAVQVFESWRNQKEKDRKTLSGYGDLLSLTSFKSVEIPEQDYTEYLRVKSRSKSEARRLVDSLLVVRDALDEDPRKLYGVLDLQEVIQVIASKSPRLDVFMLDENMSKSYAWLILLDVSRSMRYNKDFALELFLILSDVADQILLDSSAWALYGFNDRFHVIKDPKERYNAKVRARIGGLRFEGVTYMPDALTVAGEVIRKKAESLRLVTIISDGWPCGYSDMDAALAGVVKTLEARGISLTGIGVKSNRMEFFFSSNCPVYSLRDLTKKFSGMYIEASRVAAET